MNEAMPRGPTAAFHIPETHPDSLPAANHSHGPATATGALGRLLFPIDRLYESITPIVRFPQISLISSTIVFNEAISRRTILTKISFNVYLKDNLHCLTGRNFALVRVT